MAHGRAIERCPSFSVPVSDPGTGCWSGDDRMRLEQLSLFDPTCCQRWRDGQHHWRPVHEGGFDARRYRLVQVPEAPVRRFVTTHHYSHSFPAARLNFGLFEGEHLVGAAVLGVPMHPHVLTRPFPTLTG